MEFIDFQHYLWNYNSKKELKTFVFTEAKQIWPQVSVKDKFKNVSLSWCLSKAIKYETKHNKNVYRRITWLYHLKLQQTDSSKTTACCDLFWAVSLFSVYSGLTICCVLWDMASNAALLSTSFLRDAKVVGTTESCKGAAATAVPTKINVPSRGTSLTLGQTTFS